MCKTWIKIVYIYRGIWCHTRLCVKTLRSTNPWMNVPKWSKLQRISPCSGSREQWTLCREHVNRNTVHAWSVISLLIILTSWLSESGVLTKRDMRNMQSGGGRGLELSLFFEASFCTWRTAQELNFFNRPLWGLFRVKPVLETLCMTLATVL